MAVYRIFVGVLELVVIRIWTCLYELWILGGLGNIAWHCMGWRKSTELVGVYLYPAVVCLSDSDVN